MIDFGLADKAVIVTGGAGGLGRAFARGFVAAGARVHAGRYRRSSRALGG